MLIDTHCHLNFDSYDGDLEAVLQRAADVGVTRIIIPAVDLVTGQEGLDLAERYPGDRKQHHHLVLLHRTDRRSSAATPGRTRVPMEGRTDNHCR